MFKSGWIGSGPKAAEFEKAFAGYTGARYAVSVNSGTAALHLACLAAGIGPGDEVLVPAFTFVSTAHAPVYCGASVIFVDVEPDTLTMDPIDLERKITPRSRAVIPVHYGGQPCRMDEIWSIAEDRGLDVIEDAAHACGASFQGAMIGGQARSRLSCFSFNALKNLTTGDGGMVTTNDGEAAAGIRTLRWMGINKSTYERAARTGPAGGNPVYHWFYAVESLGFKSQMNDISAAIGLAQLARLDESMARRRTLAALYTREFESLEWLRLPKERPQTSSAWNLFTIRTPHREALRLHLNERGISSSVHYFPLHLHPFYRGMTRGTSLAVTEKAAEQILTIPFHPNLEESEIERVFAAVREFEPL